MKFVRILAASALLATTSVAAQSLTESLSPTDTIGIHRRRIFLTTDYTYSFHAATQLSGLQLVPLLRQPTDSAMNQLTARARRRYILPVPLILGSYGLMLGAVRANPLTNPELSGTLLIGSVSALTTGYIAGLSAPGIMHRAVQRHNLLVNTREATYVKPRPTNGALELTSADTIGVKRQLLASRYTYRGIQIVPELQLRSAMLSFNDPFITEGLRQNAVVSRIGGIIGAFSASFLALYYVTRLPLQASGRRVGPTNSLVYYALTGVAVSFTLGRITDKTTRQLAERYNRQITVVNYQLSVNSYQ